MRHNIKSIISFVVFAVLGVLAALNVISGLFRGKILLLHHEGWTKFADAPAAFTIGLIASVFAVIFFGLFSLNVILAMRSEMIARRRRRNTPTFERPELRSSVSDGAKK
jgi:hypothetical protein